YFFKIKVLRNLFHYLATLMQYATILKQLVCKFLSVGVLRGKERSDQLRFMRSIASGIFADVRLYGRDGLRAVRRIIWLGYKEKNGTAWKLSLSQLNKSFLKGPSASFDQFLTRPLLAPIYPGRRYSSIIWLLLRRVRINAGSGSRTARLRQTILLLF